MSGEDAPPPEQDLAEPLMDLTNLGRTVDGSGFAYRALSCVNKRINPIKCIEAYTHLQKIDLSQNAIKDVSPLKGLPFVLTLNLASNEINSIKTWEEGSFANLTDLVLDDNALTALMPMPFPALRRASFARNDISTCAEFTGHEKLTSLDLSKNKLTSAAGIANMPALLELNLAGGLKNENPTNQLESIEGLAGIEALQKLDLSQNKFSIPPSTWEGLTNLESLDISRNCIERRPDPEKPPEHPLKVLRQLPKLRTLQVEGNPFTQPEEDDPEDYNMRSEILLCHWRLETLDGLPVSDDDKEAARLLNLKRLEEERARKKAEEEAQKVEEDGS
jgi:Leucine-rich repeat (LRR) protein